MAFLNKAALQRTAEVTQVADHPLLKNGDIPMNVKQAYVQGCVLATLMDDEKVSDDERTAVRKIGKSLHLDDGAIQECFEVILGLRSQDDKLACLNEVISAIGTGDARFYFTIDFEQLLCLNGVPNEDGYGILDYIGRALFGKEDWRFDVFNYEKKNISAESAKRYLVAAEQTGNRWDCGVAGIILCWGCGVEKNEARGAGWLMKAAQQGVSDAQLRIGMSYKLGVFGVEKDIQMAADWFKKSANGGDLRGAVEWGRCLLDGLGVVKNANEAVKWFEKAANSGLADAQCMLAKCCQKGLGIVADATSAVKWFSKAAEQGNADALIGLGECYGTGTGIAQDQKKAVELYRQAAGKGSLGAYLTLAVSYHDGKGVSQDYGEAVKWYLKAVEWYDTTGKSVGVVSDGFLELQIGTCYMEPASTVHNEAEGFKWWKLSAEKGDATGQYFTGLNYEYGTGVERNLHLAHEWICKSAAQGYEPAKKELANLAECFTLTSNDVSSGQKGFWDSLFS